MPCAFRIQRQHAEGITNLYAEFSLRAIRQIRFSLRLPGHMPTQFLPAHSNDDFIGAANPGRRKHIPSHSADMLRHGLRLPGNIPLKGDFHLQKATQLLRSDTCYLIKGLPFLLRKAGKRKARKHRPIIDKLQGHHERKDPFIVGYDTAFRRIALKKQVAEGQIDILVPGSRHFHLRQRPSEHLHKSRLRNKGPLPHASQVLPIRAQQGTNSFRIACLTVNPLFHRPARLIRKFHPSISFSGDRTHAKKGCAGEGVIQFVLIALQRPDMRISFLFQRLLADHLPLIPQNHPGKDLRFRRTFIRKGGEKNYVHACPRFMISMKKEFEKSRKYRVSARESQNRLSSKSA